MFWSPWLAGDKDVLEKVQEKAVKMFADLTESTYEDRGAVLGLETLQRRDRQDITLVPVFCIRFLIRIRIRIRIHVFLGLPDPDPLVRGMDPDPDLDPSIILLSSSKKRQTLIPIVL